VSAEFVVDNSVVIGWCFADEGDGYAESVLDSLTSGRAYVPAVWPLEVGNVLLSAERRGRLSRAAAVRFMALLGDLPISVEQETPERMLKEIVSLAREHDLSTYDASYLDLAMRLGLPLATRDASLIRAAALCKVRVYEPTTV